MRSVLRLLAALLGGFAAAALPAQVAAPSVRVLFIGNSLTDENNLPSIVRAMAQLQGVRLEYTALTPGGVDLQDHWIDRDPAFLAVGDYDFVVLQQGPSTLPSSQDHLSFWATAWAVEARQFGTQTALYMIWPDRVTPNGFGLVAQSYRRAATAAGAAIYPAGEAWQQVLARNAAIPLYGADGFHPSPTGSFLAAMVIARGLVGLDPDRVPVTVDGITLPAATLAVFRSVVAEQPATMIAESDHAVALPGSASSTSPSTPATPATSPTPADAMASGSGGGGAPSSWFLCALATAIMLRALMGRTKRSG